MSSTPSTCGGSRPAVPRGRVTDVRAVLGYLVLAYEPVTAAPGGVYRPAWREGVPWLITGRGFVRARSS
jgi:hypothetical protein